MRTDTEPVIPQNLDDATLSGMARIIRVGHPHQLFPKLRENGHAPVHGRELLPRNLVGRCAVL